jgi:hypothetical protein
MVVECIILEDLQISKIEGKSNLELVDYVVEMISIVDSNFKQSEMKQIKLLGKQNEIIEDNHQTSSSKKSHSSCKSL